MDTTLLKGLSLLELLVKSDQPRGITDLADELGWKKSNVHRVLHTLIHAGYVKKDSMSGRYDCTLKLWELGTLVSEHIDIRLVARQQVEALAAGTGETVHLSVLEGSEVLYIDKIDSQHPVRSYTRMGGRAPAYCVATGKALLAYAPERVLQAVISQIERHTPRTITDPAMLQKELAIVREKGFAMNQGEWRETVFGLAAPVLGANGQAVAAIGISGPAERLNIKTIRKFIPNVIAAANAIAIDLGFSIKQKL